MEPDQTKEFFPHPAHLVANTPLTWQKLSFLERTIIAGLAGVALISGIVFLSFITQRITVVAPAPGGAITEGIVGTPRFINPVLAQSDADRELSMLIFSGLMRALPDGSITTDLADSYEVSEDGTVYTVKLRDDAVFHDGKKVSSYDVAFTVLRTQEPAIGSPLDAVWAGIRVDTPDEKTVVFTLSQPYAAFLDNLTLGILPQHLWEDVSPENFGTHALNTEPIGTGPFAFSHISRNKSGIPTTYLLRSFKESTRGRPHLNEIEIRIFGNQKELLAAFEDGDVDSFDSLEPAEAAALQDTGISVATYELPRIFGVFFNQNKNDALTSDAVRKALALAVDKNKIVTDVLHGFGTVIDAPLPPHLFPPQADTTSIEDRQEQARRMLSDAGWAMDTETGLLTKKDATLDIVLTTANTPELKEAAEHVVENWRTIGVNASLELFDTGQLHREIIRPRSYEALLFGEVVGRDGDLFPFWHSSQRNDPGLNVALYTSITGDAILEHLRTTPDPTERAELFTSFVEEVTADVPAIFLYTPDLLYVPPKHVSGIEIGVVHSPAERFLDVERWYMHTQRIWNVFGTTQ